MKTSRKVYSILFLSLVCIGLGVYLGGLNRATTFIIVRHAERFDTSSNTNLSDAGLERARYLIDVAGDADISAIYSTNFCRTLQTAQPLAQHLRLPIQVQQIGSGISTADCNPAISVDLEDVPAAINDESLLVQHMLGASRGKTVLVVGHSNTVPAMVAVLGDGNFDPVEIADDAYGNLFIVKKYPFFWSPTLIQARFGGSSQ